MSQRRKINRIMTTDKTLRKADTALDVITEFDDKDVDCSFKEFLQEVIARWSKQN